MSTHLSHRRAVPDDAPRIAPMNQRLIQDEGHRNPMTLPELEQRMRGWLENDYTGVLFEDTAGLAAYALFRDEPEQVFLRHLYVERDRRRRGYGREAVQILRQEVWPTSKRVTLDVLMANQAALAFWEKIGFREYCRTFEINAP